MTTRNPTPARASGTHPTRGGLLILVAANLPPLFGILFLDWSLFGLLLLYWAETGVIGLFHLAKIIHVCKHQAFRIGGFFCFHFGMFMTVHLIFLLSLFGQHQRGSLLPVTGSLPSLGFGFFISLALLFAAHSAVFLRELNLPEEERWARPAAPGLEISFGRPSFTKEQQRLLSEPYPRVLVVHFMVLFGGFLKTQLKAGGGLDAVLVLLKLGLETWIFLKPPKIKMG